MAAAPRADAEWREELASALPRFGHRNWILVADSAYPAQVSPGIRVIDTGATHQQALRVTLAAIEEAAHVTAILWVDAELKALDETDAPGIAAWRRCLEEMQLGPRLQPAPHEVLIARVAEAAGDFEVLVLKTIAIVPYTTVFLELDCAYWDADREAALRRRLNCSMNRTP